MGNGHAILDNTDKLMTPGQAFAMAVRCSRQPVGKRVPGPTGHRQHAESQRLSPRRAFI